MKRFLAVSAFLLCTFAAVAVDRVTVNIVVTNGTVNANTLVVNGVTRTWTNSVVTPSSQILTNSTIGGVTTNLWNHVVSYPFSLTTPLWVATNQMRIVGNVGVAMSASAAGTWATITYSTQTVVAAYTVRVPMSVEVNAVRTNVATQLAIGIPAYSLVAVDQSATAFSSLVGTTNTQTISGQKTFTGSTFFSAPQTTNLVNIGNAISSPGSGTSSEQFGSGALATNSNALAVGKDASSDGQYGVALGNSALAEGEYSTALGALADAVGARSIAIGTAAISDGNDSVAIGNNSTANAFTNSIALGKSVAATAANQIRLGTSSHTTVIPGVLDVDGSITNTTYHGTVGLLNSGVWNGGSATNLTSTNTTVKGTTTLTGIVKLTRTDYTSLATGNNAGVDFGSATYVKIDSGPGAAFTINGIAGGTDGRLLVLDNRVAQNMTIAHDSGVDATPANRIYCPTAADMSTTTYGVVMLVYDSEDSRWHLISLQD